MRLLANPDVLAAQIVHQYHVALDLPAQLPVQLDQVLALVGRVDGLVVRRGARLADQVRSERTACIQHTARACRHLMCDSRVIVEVLHGSCVAEQLRRAERHRV